MNSFIQRVKKEMLYRLIQVSNENFLRNYMSLETSCPGLIRAVQELFPDSDIQRCTKHRTDNILDLLRNSFLAIFKPLFSRLHDTCFFILQ